MSAAGDVIKVLEYRRNPNPSNPLVHEFKVLRRGRKRAVWESLESLLNVDRKLPMARFCSAEHVTWYVEQLKRGEVVVEFEIDRVLAEKRVRKGFLYRIRWKDWPQEYDTWEHESAVPKHFVDEFRRKNQSPLGALGFDTHYWDTNYSQVWMKYMDGATAENCQTHALYAYAFFKKFGIHNSIRSIADFGFGMGGHLEAFTRKFRPRFVYGLEPSPHAFDKFVKEKGPETKRSAFAHCHFHAECVDILTYCLRELRSTRASEDMCSLEKDLRRAEQKEGDAETRESCTHQVIRSIPALIDQMAKLHTQQKKPQQCDPDVAMKDCSGRDVFHCTRTKKQEHSPQRGLKSHDRKDASKRCGCRWNGMFNVGLFVSVGQYLDDETFECAMKCLSMWCDFLYMDVVTEEEYRIMVDGSQFVDQYAIRRPRAWYWNVIKRHWRIVGNAILESKFLYDFPETSNVPTLLFHCS